jgi:hypothetical protein
LLPSLVKYESCLWSKENSDFEIGFEAATAAKVPKSPKPTPKKLPKPSPEKCDEGASSTKVTVRIPPAVALPPKDLQPQSSSADIRRQVPSEITRMYVGQPLQRRGQKDEDTYSYSLLPALDEDAPVVTTPIKAVATMEQQTKVCCIRNSS